MQIFKRPKLLIFIILGAALIALTFWHFVNFRVPEEELPGPQKRESSVEGSSGNTIIEESAIVKIAVEGDEFHFSPSSFSVPRGSTVELTFKNVGRASHNFTVDELGLATKTIGSGKTDTLIFTTPDNPSAIAYSSYCSVFGHRSAGMEGTIVIE